jgi:triacylglycerol lipase
MTAQSAASAAYSGDFYHEDPSVEEVQTPLWRESFFMLDWLSLRMSGVYWGWGVPRGNGEPVVVVPGFLASDISVSELWAWLARLGYRPYFSHIGRNDDCPDYVSRDLIKTIRRAYDDTGKPVSLIGHSLGGLLSRSIALDHPEHVRMVITLGSPFRDSVRAHPAVMAAADTIRRSASNGGQLGKNVGPTCFTGHCTCNFVKNLLAPAEFEVPRYALYSKRDGVVDWETCIEDDPKHNYEVNATHIGMAFNPGVFRIIGKLLAGQTP